MTVDLLEAQKRLLDSIVCPKYTELVSDLCDIDMLGLLQRDTQAKWIGEYFSDTLKFTYAQLNNKFFDAVIAYVSIHPMQQNTWYTRIEHFLNFVLSSDVFLNHTRFPDDIRFDKNLHISSTKNPFKRNSSRLVKYCGVDIGAVDSLIIDKLRVSKAVLRFINQPDTLEGSLQNFAFVANGEGVKVYLIYEDTYQFLYYLTHNDSSKPVELEDGIINEMLREGLLI